MGSKAEGRKDGSGEQSDACWGVGSIRILGTKPEDNEVYPLYFMVDNQPVKQGKWYSIPNSEDNIHQPDTVTKSRRLRTFNSDSQTGTPKSDTKDKTNQLSIATKSRSVRALKSVSPTKTLKSKLKVKSNSHTTIKSKIKPTKQRLKRQSIPVKGVSPPYDPKLHCVNVPISQGNPDTTKDIRRFGQQTQAVLSVPMPKPVASSIVPNVFVSQGSLFENTNGQSSFKRTKIEDIVKTLRENRLKHKCSHPKCGRLFNKASQFSKHMQVHSNLRQFKCDFCGKGYNTKPCLYEHRKIHNDRKPYKCKFCDVRFTFCSNRNSHQRTHTGEKPYVCEFCERRFASRSTLVRHIRVHTKETPYICQFCGRACRQYQGLKNHIKTHHSDLCTSAKIQIQQRASVTYSCTMCGETFDYKALLEIHRRKHFADQDTVSQIKTELSDENPLMYRVLEGSSSAEPVVLMREDLDKSMSNVLVSITKIDREGDHNVPSVAPASFNRVPSTLKSGLRGNSGISSLSVRLSRAKTDSTTSKEGSSNVALASGRCNATKKQGIENTGSGLPIPLQKVVKIEKCQSKTKIKRRGKVCKGTPRPSPKKVKINPIHPGSLEMSSLFVASPMTVERRKDSSETVSSSSARRKKIQKKPHSRKTSSSSPCPDKVPRNNDSSGVSSPSADQDIVPSKNYFRVLSSSTSPMADKVQGSKDLSTSSCSLAYHNELKIKMKTRRAPSSTHSGTVNAKFPPVGNSPKALNFTSANADKVLQCETSREMMSLDTRAIQGDVADFEALRSSNAKHLPDANDTPATYVPHCQDSNGTMLDASGSQMITFETLRFPDASNLSKGSKSASNAAALKNTNASQDGWVGFETLRFPDAKRCPEVLKHNSHNQMFLPQTDPATQDSGSFVHEISAPDFGTFLKTYQKKIVDNPSSVFHVRNDNDSLTTNDDVSLSSSGPVAREGAPIVYDTDVMQQSFRQADSESVPSYPSSLVNQAPYPSSFHKNQSCVYDFTTHQPLNNQIGNCYQSSDNSTYVVQDTAQTMTYDAVSLNNPQCFIRQNYSVNGQYVYTPNTLNLYNNTAPSRCADIVNNVAQQRENTSPATTSEVPSIECFLPQMVNSQNY